LNVWIMAIRPATLSAAVAPVLVGTAVAGAHGQVHGLVFGVTLVAALCIQIGTNLANDLFDFQHGADTADRLGPPRVTQTGLMSPAQVHTAMVVAFGAAVLCGCYLAVVGGWPIVMIGVLSIAAGVAYTGGPWPLGYHGLGDVFVFVFFGLVAVMGTFYLHTQTLSGVAAGAAIPVGFLVTAILVVNNLRDIDTDRRANKRTLAVRIGAGATRAQYVALIAGAYAVPWLFVPGLTAALPLLTLPLAIGLSRSVLAGTAGGALNPVLKRTAGLHLAYSCLFAVAFLV
jgi:1,4-dihydroxy-2-naphthoate octaprenyltransferase